MDRALIEGCCTALTRIDEVMKKLDRQDTTEAKCFPAFGLMFRMAETENGEARLRMTEISKYLHVTKPAATYIVNQMVERGLVRRVNAGADKRVTYIEMTDEGREIFEQSMEQRLGYLGRAAERMGMEHATAFWKLFNEFLDALACEMEED